jgi:transcriptional regulator with XRE-family HTH domain
LVRRSSRKSADDHDTASDQATFGREELRVLGLRLRGLREARGLSLRRLSEESGVSVAAIQSLEAGGGNPGLLTVLSIAEALGEPVDRLVADSQRSARPRTLVRGKLPRRLPVPLVLGDALDRPRMRSVVMPIPAGGALAASDRPHEVPLFAYVIEGTVEIRHPDGRTDRLRAGDAIHVADAAPANWTNPQSSRRSVVLCLTEIPGTGTN